MVYIRDVLVNIINISNSDNVSSGIEIVNPRMPSIDLLEVNQPIKKHIVCSDNSRSDGDSVKEGCELLALILSEV